MDHESTGEDTGATRPPRDPGKPGFDRPAPVRTARLVSGDFLLTVNPVDGSEIELRPPGTPVAFAGTVPDAPSAGTPRRTPQQRAEHERAGRPPAPAGPAPLVPPLLGREDERAHIGSLLSRGRSLRITGPRGSGRTALLDAVAADCARLAPDGVIRLNGRHRTPADLLYELFAAVHHAPSHRPARARLLEHVAAIGAVVVVDDLEFGGSALAELLDAAPECAFLLAACPDAPEPPAALELAEVALPGLDRTTSLELLRHLVDRPLAEDETNWAGDLWFESDGLPLRFVQAGALLRQGDALQERLRDDPDGFDAFAPPEGVEDGAVALPTLGQGAAPAALLASRLGEAARRTLRFAVALGGELPHQTHLPALVGDTHADTAIGELLRCGLLSPAGGCYRLAAGALLQLKEKGYGDAAEARAHTVAQHYTWWTAHPSVTPERVAVEADAVLAALTALVASREDGHSAAAVRLARSAAPALAAGLHWSAWERALRAGSEAARQAGEVAEEAYFHHELGVLALCTGGLDRARAELETSIGMRGALADRIGTVVGRRALALVEDRENGRVPAAAPVPVAPDAARARAGLPPVPRPAALPPALSSGGGAAVSPRDQERRGGTQPLPVISGATVTVPQTPVPAGPAKRPAARLAVLRGTRRNLAAGGAVVLLAAVVGAMITLGPAGRDEDPKGGPVRETTSEGVDEREGEGSGQSADGSGAGTPGTPETLPGRTAGTVPRPGGGTSPSASVPPGTPGTSLPPSRPPAPSDPASPSGPPPGPTTPPRPSGSGSPPLPSPTPSQPPAPSPSAPTVPPTTPSSRPPVSPSPPDSGTDPDDPPGGRAGGGSGGTGQTGERSAP
ncbi:ATP-binding protein [Streptomyces clavuligerus]|uniref:DUF605 multi-domain protein n=4 Tax=Streptomyces clavuligerus TaxID=1901 RepID=E2Q6S0_STRCL|nr:hypothetical protein [Streptomyces clavuligerus]ANW18051.1 AAA family ATPase [Streptomyces clavuligerus]AXU12611.1 ATP-binding protein [Streptomyces clavuligerus]EFG09369.1 DUF605 multi-domain protein [Streptomyces clavuligerus]MBY6302511.1 ATP-binding protein [Streptomyces clavuligerus]QCS05392.1 AAA family ATPase [Streptomyces clavuligerus]